MNLDCVLTAIDSIYETAGAAQRWPVALDRIAACFDAKGSLLITKDADHSLKTVVSPALAEAQADYEAGWWREDFASLRALEQGYLLTGNVVSDGDIITLEERRTHPFFTVFRARHGLGGFLASSISPVRGVTTWLSVQLPAGAAAVDENHRTLVEKFVRHCERALLLTCQIDRLHLVNAALEEALARLGCGVFLVDGSGKVTHANSAGERMLATDLQLVGGRLAIAAPEARRALDGALASALRDTPEDRVACTQPVIVKRKSGGRPLVAYVLPVRTEAAARIWQHLQVAAALVVVVDLETSGGLDPALVRDYLGLTLGEARVAAHVGLGATPRETASRLGITEETVRTTLKRIFSKTGVSRQAELTGLLARLDLVAPSGPS